MSAMDLPGWDRLRHGGLLLDPPRLRQVAGQFQPPRLQRFFEDELRRRLATRAETSADVSEFVAFVLQKVCRFSHDGEAWLRGSQVGSEWGRKTVAGDIAKPRHLWRGRNGAVLPVFIDTEQRDGERRLGIGRSRRAISNAIQWLRGGAERLAVVTNGRQFRLVFAGLDFDAWCEWDVDLWLEEGELSTQVSALRTLIAPELWTPAEKGAAPPLLAAIQDSRKGQAELSAVLGERVREAVELLVQAHGELLKARCAGVDPAEIYRAAVRTVMRMVVVLFAESRELLPREQALYHGSYGLTGLLEDLEKLAARGGSRLARSFTAWPRILALFRLVFHGSHHPALAVPAYGGELFAPGDAGAADGLSRALAVFESGALEQELFPDREVYRLLERLTRTRVRVRQGKSTTWIPAPVDFSDLSSEYIGILYEGLLDFELRTAPAGDPVVFLAVGNQPALPLWRLEAMDDKTLANLLDKMKDASKPGDAGDEEDGGGEEAVEGGSDDEDDGETPLGEDEADTEVPAGAFDADAGPEDERHVTRTRAEAWAVRAVEAGKLVRKPSGAFTPERRARYEADVARKARQLVVRVLLPGEWYLVRWGGTRKGSGTFYTRPGLAVPTLHRTLSPLAYDPPAGPEGQPNKDAPATEWTPMQPEEILALKVCDPACGSGTFPVSALRFLTDALYASLHHHGRFSASGDRTIVGLLSTPTPPVPGSGSAASLGQELLPCRPDDPTFEPRLKAVLRRHIVERCIYGVDLDPLAVELCRLALWIETMDRSLPFSFLDHKIKCGNSLVGAWFDQFQHYPVMAWKNREGGDKNHANGVHFEKETRTKAIKAFVKERLTPDLRRWLSDPQLPFDDMQIRATSVHDEALAALAKAHDVPVHDSAERARVYREELLGSETYRSIKAAMDLWCACWFWPADDLPHAPLPSTFAAPPKETAAVSARVAQSKRFFHWELEFPDVFRAPGAGFDAVLGNPPWDIAKPNSKEYFSNIDPLYRSYGKQEALRQQSSYFSSAEVERAWLDYNADFRAQSNLMGYAAEPFGDPAKAAEPSERFAIAGGAQGASLHDRWLSARSKARGFADPEHPFRHQGAADINLYKAFLEQGTAVLRSGGRLGFIVPSGLYSDHGTGGLRKLFLDRCQWEWLFGFENREKVFDIDSRFKFNPVIIQKGGSTQAIRTAFMRRKLEDWEHAEELATSYTRTQVEHFSPKSKAILEIQSKRDLEILEKIYANSVLLGDDGPNGWGIKYSTEFHMTNDSKLFPPRPWWEAQGYRPDEYSRWLNGDWRPIAELWAELGVDPNRVVPVDVELEEWLFDTSQDGGRGFSRAEGSRAEREARHAHGHLLKPGDVQRTNWRLRCAQPPYDSLPIPRAGIPAGIILSREADAWIREDRIEDTALPLYEGRMIGQFDFSQKGWVSGKGRSAVWREIPWDRKQIEPQFLMRRADYRRECLDGYLRGVKDAQGAEAATAEARRLSSSEALESWWLGQADRVGFMDVTSATNTRTLIATLLPIAPCGNKVPTLRLVGASRLGGLLSSFIVDYEARRRIGGLTLNYFILAELGLPRQNGTWLAAGQLTARLAGCDKRFSWLWAGPNPVGARDIPVSRLWALTGAERVRLRSVLDAMWLIGYGLRVQDSVDLFEGCDSVDAASVMASPKGFWRVDRDKDPELRHTVLTLVAFHDLEQKTRDCGGDREKGIEAFLSQNGGEGWMLPETLRLADYGLGHDDRAKVNQPVASRLGPRFFDWQLTQSAEESWRECHLHARNLLGEAGYRQLVAEKGSPTTPTATDRREASRPDSGQKPGTMKLFD